MYLATVEGSARKGARNPALAGLHSVGATTARDPSTFMMSAGLAGTGIALGVGAMGTIFFIGSALEARSKVVKISGYTLAALSGVGLIMGIMGLTAGLLEKKSKPEVKAPEAAAPAQAPAATASKTSGPTEL